ncbi:MAG: HAD family hydrolase [Kiritimatiellae bacterium]|jgi:phosphoglycolate phosphatase|nr:HAD family hydrolase [Kiritimatiellia bacterium]
MSEAKTIATLFDLDGTLVDSLPDIAASMNQVLESHSFPVHSLEAYKLFVGEGMRKLAECSLPKNLKENRSFIDDVVTEMKTVYSVHWRENPLPYAGIPKLLDTLQKKGIRMGVLSNKPEEFTLEMVQYVFPKVPFDPVRGAREGIPLKPSADSALAILREWNLRPEQVFYVGDTSTDILTGRNAGMPTIGVTWGFRDRAELEAAGATHVIDHPRELAERILPAQ